MKISFWVIGKNTPSFVEEGVKMYEKRIKHYTNFEVKYFPLVKSSKNMPKEELLKKEAQMILGKLSSRDQLVLLDERGKMMTSIEFSKYLNQKMVANVQSLVFLIGGAYGFHSSIYEKAQGKISLGKGTYSHQIIRIMFLEQLYRGFTIIRGEKYHNE